MATPHFVVNAPASAGGKAEAWGKRAEEAYGEITEKLDLRPRQKIPLYLYFQHRDFREAAGVRPHDLVVGQSHYADGRIELDVSGLFANAKRTLRHEIVHSVLALGLGPRIGTLPTWFNEGLAQVAGQPDDPAAEERVREARGAGALPELRQLADRFPRGEESGVAYAASYSAVAYFVELFGWEGVQRLLDRMRQGDSYSTAFRKATGIDSEEFAQGWRSTLVRRGLLEWIQLFYFPATGLMMIWAMWMAYQRVRNRHRHIEEEDEPRDDSADEDEPPDIVEPDDELDYHSGLRPNTE